MKDTQETEGLSPLLTAAIGLNEVYKSLLASGFTSDEALSLIAKMSKSHD